MTLYGFEVSEGMVSDITDKLLPRIEELQNSLKNRGVEDILILCSDGLIGLKEAIQTAFPATEHQQFIVHMVRNTLKYDANKDMTICQRFEDHLYGTR